MTDLNKMVGTPFEWKVKGRVLKISFATLNDLGEFEAWVIKKHKDNFMEVANALPPSEKNLFLLQAVKDIPSGAELARLCSDEMSTLAGSRKFLHILTRKNHPDMTEEKLFDLVTPENLAEAQDLIANMTGLNDDKKEDKKEEKLDGENEDEKKKE